MRGIDPDAAMYWMLRMLDAGDYPRFVSRRMLIFASEDVGNADPRALEVAVSADAAFRRMGMPEGMFPLAHACLYLASCPKSNAVKRAIEGARQALQDRGALPVPLSLRNAVTPLMRAERYGEATSIRTIEGSCTERAPPDEPRVPFLPAVERGPEKAIAERLARLRQRSS
jgi:putative ATPase